MTNEMMALQGLLEKTSDADLVREMLGFAAERRMELDVGSKTGAAWGEKSSERLAQRNGYRDRVWETRAGTIELVHPQAAERLVFPRLFGAAAVGREGADRGHSSIAGGDRSIPERTMVRRPSRGGLYSGHLDAVGRRPGQGSGHERHLEDAIGGQQARRSDCRRHAGQETGEGYPGSARISTSVLANFLTVRLPSRPAGRASCRDRIEGLLALDGDWPSIWIDATYPGLCIKAGGRSLSF